MICDGGFFFSIIVVIAIYLLKSGILVRLHLEVFSKGRAPFHLGSYRIIRVIEGLIRLVGSINIHMEITLIAPDNPFGYQWSSWS